MSDTENTHSGNTHTPMPAPGYLQAATFLVAQCLRVCWQCRRYRLDPWVGKITWKRKWQPTPIFLHEKSDGQRSLAGYHPQGHKRVGHYLATKQQQQPFIFNTLNQ